MNKQKYQNQKNLFNIKIEHIFYNKINKMSNIIFINSRQTVISYATNTTTRKRLFEQPSL